MQSLDKNNRVLPDYLRICAVYPGTPKCRMYGPEDTPGVHLTKIDV